MCQEADIIKMSDDNLKDKRVQFKNHNQTSGKRDKNYRRNHMTTIMWTSKSVKQKLNPDRPKTVKQKKK